MFQSFTLSIKRSEFPAFQRIYKEEQITAGSSSTGWTLLLLSADLTPSWPGNFCFPPAGGLLVSLLGSVNFFPHVAKVERWFHPDTAQLQLGRAILQVKNTYIRYEKTILLYYS